MNTQRQFEEQSNLDHERNVKMSLFMLHLEEKNVNVERDLLLHEMARLLGLLKDLRFQYFLSHCKKVGATEAQGTHSSLDMHLRNLNTLSNDLLDDTSKNPEIKELAEIVYMVETLIADGKAEVVCKLFKASFPEYYAVSENVSENE